MRILLLGEWYPPLKDWYFDEGKSKGMPAVHALYEYLGNSKDHTFYGLVYSRERAYTKHFPNGSILEIKKLSAPVYFVWKLVAMFKMVNWAIAKTQSSDFDLVYGLGSFSQVAERVGKRSNLFSIGRIYGTILTRLFAEKQYSKIYTRHVFDVFYIKKPCDYTICTLDGTAYDEICKQLNSSMKVGLLFNGMNTVMRGKLIKLPTTQTFDTKPQINLCYIARLEYYKRPWLAIELMDELVNRHGRKDFRLNLLGDGSLKNDLETQITKKNLQAHVHFVEGVNHAEIPNFLETQDVSLFFYEGGSLGNAMWESALAGRLICTIDNGATAQVMKDNINSIIVADDENAMRVLASKLINLSPNDITRITNNCRQSISEKVVDWDERFEKELDIITQRIAMNA